jgi:lipopolysaccharide/colanic/teichoic acid biosynthesis glycosyltransferase
VARHNNKSIWGPTTGPGAPTHGLNQLFAPILEIVAATTLLLCLAPILLIGSVAIKLDSGGPVFTRVTRRDTSNRPIQVLRFRVVAASVPGENNQRLSSGRCCADSKRHRRTSAILQRTAWGNFLYGSSQIPALKALRAALPVPRAQSNQRLPSDSVIR